MNLLDRFSHAPARDEQMVQVTEEVERLTPAPRTIGRIGPGPNNPETIMWQDWYETSTDAVVTVGRWFTPESISEFGQAPSAMQSWNVNIVNPRRGKRVGDFIVSNMVSVEVKIRDLSDQAKRRRAFLLRGDEIMKRAGIELPKTHMSEMTRDNLGVSHIAQPDRLIATTVTAPRVFDDGRIVSDDTIDQLSYRIEMEGRMKEYTDRMTAMRVLTVMRHLYPDDRMSRTPFAR